MSKLIYPDQGIYNQCSGSLSSCQSNINRISSRASFYNIPSDFSYRGYLSGFGNVVNGFRTEINSIGAKLRQTDNRYKNLSNQLEDRAHRTQIDKINERERLIN